MSLKKRKEDSNGPLYDREWAKQIVSVYVNNHARATAIVGAIMGIRRENVVDWLVSNDLSWEHFKACVKLVERLGETPPIEGKYTTSVEWLSANVQEMWRLCKKRVE